MDLRDLWRGDLSYRRLWVLLNDLPQESLTQTALRDDPNRENLPTSEADEERFGPWRLDNYQLSLLIDEVSQLRYAVGVAYRLDPNPVPEPTPRPGRAKRPNGASAEVAAARRYLAEFNRGKG